MQERLMPPCPAHSLSCESCDSRVVILVSTLPEHFHPFPPNSPFLELPTSLLSCLPTYVSCSWIAPFNMRSLLLGHFLGCYPQLSQPLPYVVSFRHAVMGNQCVKWRISAASVSGSGAGFTGEDMMRPRGREKRSNVAGIDQDELLDPSVLTDPDSCFYMSSKEYLSTTKYVNKN